MLVIFFITYPIVWLKKPSFSPSIKLSKADINLGSFKISNISIISDYIAKEAILMVYLGNAKSAPGWLPVQDKL